MVRLWGGHMDRRRVSVSTVRIAGGAGYAGPRGAPLGRLPAWTAFPVHRR